MLRRLSLETIAFQNDVKFKKALSAVLEPLWQDIDDVDTHSPMQLCQQYGHRIAEAFTERTGINLTVTFANNPNNFAYVMPLYLNNQHTLLNIHFHGKTLPADMRKFVRLNADKKGYVDRNKARVSGIFADYKHRLYIDPIAMVKHYELHPDEMAAILTHEVGHCFTMFEYASRIDTQNENIAALLEDVRNDRPTKENLTLVIKDLKRDDSITVEDAAALLDSNDNTVLGSRLFGVLFKSTMSQFPTHTYDKTASEQLADAFAARMGYYRELVTALDKIHLRQTSPGKTKLGYWSVVYSDLYMFFFRFYLLALFFFTVGNLLGTVLFGSSLVGGGLLSLAFAIVVMTYIVFTGEGDDNRDMTYDDLWDRYNRIKNEIITQLKDLSLTIDEKKTLLETLTTIENSQSTTFKTERIFTYMVNRLKPGAIRAKEDVNLQKLVESLSNNAFFVHSTELEILAQD